MTKKAAALLLAASLAVSVCAMPVFAADPPNMGSQAGSENKNGLDTKVLYEVTEGYTWSVPATIDFGKDAGVNKNPKVTTSVDQDDAMTNTGAAASEDNGWEGTAPKVMVTKNVIKKDKFLKIMLAPAGSSADFSVKNAEGVELKYTVTLTETTIGSVVNESNRKIGTTGTERKILAVPAGTNTAEAKLKFELSTTNESSEKAGTYEGTVQFTASIS